MSLALHTDLYQLTMAYGYFKSGLADRETVFHHFFRKKPFGGEYAIAGGLADLIDFVKNFAYSADDLDYLRSTELFDEPFLDYLSEFKFELEIKAAPEGTVIFPYEPIIQVQGSLLQAQLLESALLNIVNFQTLIATKASRICLAAEGQEVIEFGMRRAQGVNGALSASRASIIGGCSSTSNVLAGKLYGVKVRGTHAHSWVMAYGSETEAFEKYADAMPNNVVYLVDTYDSIEGTRKAIRVAKEKKVNLLGVRIDSGDLAQLSIEIRQMLDEAGLKETQIIASNDLDEFIIRDLKHQGAKVDVWGVGTALSTAKGQPALDGVYKLSAIKDEEGVWQPTIKISEQLVKVTNPGVLDVRRFYTDQGFIGDMIFDHLNPPPENPTLIHPLDQSKKKKIMGSVEYQDVLVPVFHEGNLVYELPSLLEIQAYAQEQIERFHPSITRFMYPNPYFVGLEKGLYDRKMIQIEKIQMEPELV